MGRQIRWERLRPMHFSIVVLFIIATLMTNFAYFTQPARASGFSMQTGYFVGNGVAGHAISGVGFRPELVLIKAHNAATQTTALKTSTMAANVTASMGAVSDSTSSDITFQADGFSLNSTANVNGTNIIYNWTAFTGSDCSASGTFCLGSWTGTGSGARAVTSVGFQADMAIVKQQHTAANYRTSLMPTDTATFFNATAANTTGGYISQFTPTGFDVGASNNLNGPTYYFIAFKNSSTFNIGSYTGDGTDNRDITSVGFRPSFVVVKNNTNATANNRRAVMATNQYNGDNSSYIGDPAADATNFIQALQPTGFQVGSGINVNQTGDTMYWFAFGGASTNMPPGNGTYTMATGSYTGTGSPRAITGVPFKPDLIIIKAANNNWGVFRTSLMAGDVTAYFAAAAAEFTSGVTAINSDGFSLGTAAPVNSSGIVYHWQAFGNAYNPETRTGAADFTIGGYIGTGVDNRDISNLPYQLDLLTVKQNGNITGAFRTSAHAADSSSYFSATADASNLIQGFNSTGFQLGTDAGVNTTGSLYRWFGFKSSGSFAVGTYTGDGIDNTAVTLGGGFQPDLAWVKRNINTNFVHRSSSIVGDSSQYVTQAFNASNLIQSFTTTGMTVGTNVEVNALGGSYHYASWRVPPSGAMSVDIVNSTGSPVASPNYTMNSIGFPFSCSTSVGKLGTSSQAIRITNTTNNPSWTLSIAATNGSTARWSNGGNTIHYDYNDQAGSPAGCSDGDGDGSAGQLSINPDSGALAPQTGCSNTNVSFGSAAAFQQGSMDNITMAVATIGAPTHCYWDLTGIDLAQTIPTGQTVDSYNLNFTVTLVAS